MSLSVGDKAPDFTLVTLTDQGPALFHLQDQLQEGNVLLLFVPMAFTGGCTREFCDISKNLSKYEQLNAEVLGISGDNPFAQENWAKQEGITLRLLSDYEHKVSEAYGCSYESFLPEKNLIMGGVPKRSAFIIDQEGIIQYAEVLENPSDMPNFEAIDHCLKGLS